MRAFVLSGGGNRGPLEVGALRALHDWGVRPNLLIGTSAGAINASFVAAHGFTVDALDGLADRWREVDSRTIYPGGPFSAARRVLRRANSLYSSDGVRKLIEDSLPPGVTTFGQLQIPLFVPAADLLSNKLYMFGEDAGAPLVDAVLASASVPVIHPPVRYGAMQLVDGGVLANVAASYAMDSGAQEIFVINVSSTEQSEGYAEGVVDVAFRTLNTMLVQALLRDLARARENEEIDLHHVYIGAFRDVWFKDFSRTEEMFAAGYDVMTDYLRTPKPMSAGPERHSLAMPEEGSAAALRELPTPYP